MAELHKAANQPASALRWELKAASLSETYNEGKIVELFGYIDAYALFPVVLEKVRTPGGKAIAM